jgi:hypothetical protein
MTLLETLVALSILSIVLVFLFGYFRDLSEINRMADQSQKESFQMRYLESRLGFIFERLVNEKLSAGTFFFYTEPPLQGKTLSTSLILTFDNEVRIDPTYSGDVLGRIYLDQDHSLRLGIWPLHTEDPSEHFQEEVLMEEVKEVRFEFYAAPEKIKDSKEIHTKKIDPNTPQKDYWHQDEWAMAYKQMPSIIKVKIKLAKVVRQGSYLEDDELLSYSFVLPSSKNLVQYPPEGILE